jgi:hypothetical protein
MSALIFFVFGVAAIFIALWMVFPVMVNLPDSWFGALLVLLLLAGGSALIYLGAKAFQKRKPTVST